MREKTRFKTCRAASLNTCKTKVKMKDRGGEEGGGGREEASVAFKKNRFRGEKPVFFKNRANLRAAIHQAAKKPQSTCFVDAVLLGVTIVFGRVEVVTVVTLGVKGTSRGGDGHSWSE